MDDNQKKPHPNLQEEVLSHTEDKTLGLSLHQNFWYPSIILPGVIYIQKHFKAHDNDIIVASQPKSGTTWLKALTFSIINRSNYPISESPLLKSNPHSLIPTMEFTLYTKKELPCFDNVSAGTPRLLSTHMPYTSLPESIKNSNCRIIYICRNPCDSIVSHWHFSRQFKGEQSMSLSVDELAEHFMNGESHFGPFWEHVLSYWNESLRNPKKVLFLKYEDMKENIKFHVKDMAEFLGCPFSCEEESNGVVDQIIELCSLKTLRNLAVNKNGKLTGLFDNNAFFRKGEVGDWINYLDSSLAEAINNVIKEKLSGSGLDL